MAVTHKPVFAQSRRTVSAVATAAKNTHNDAANAVKLCDAGPNGSLLRLLSAIPRATVTATGLQLYRSPDDGVTLILTDSALMAAHTVAATTAIPKTKFADITEETSVGFAAGETLWFGIGTALAAGIVVNGQVEDM